MWKGTGDNCGINFFLSIFYAYFFYFIILSLLIFFFWYFIDNSFHTLSCTSNTISFRIQAKSSGNGIRNMSIVAVVQKKVLGYMNFIVNRYENTKWQLTMYRKAKKKTLGQLFLTVLALSRSLSHPLCLCCCQNCYRHLGQDFNYSFDALS